MRTVLYDEHVKLNGKIIDFHGWDMPLYYDSIIKEHMFVRRLCGIFDVSHMGDIYIEGRNAEEFIKRMVPTDVGKLKNFDCAYTAFLDENGNMIDDTIIYKFNNEKFLCVPNASMKDIILNHLKKNLIDNVELKDVSDILSCIAVQGPVSEEVMRKIGYELPGPFTFYEKDGVIISGTGYTGEKGCEIIINNVKAVEVWRNLVNILKEIESGPCGLGARDTLRMEKGMLLSGQDFSGDRNPYESSISFIIDMNHDFIGRNKIENKQVAQTFKGFIMEENNMIPRHGYIIYDNSENEIGIVTSGSISPVLNKGIALGYLNKNSGKNGDIVLINIRGKNHPAKISRPKMVN